MAEPATKKKTSSTMLLDCSHLSDCVSKLQVFSSPSAKMAENKMSMPQWSLLPEELLHLILTYLDNCFDVIHARSVCRPWRSTFPFPCCLLRPTYSLPKLAEFTLETKDLCTLVKIPLFLFRVQAPDIAASVSTSEYLLGGICREDHMELSSPIQCSVKVKIPGSDQTLFNMLDCQILPLGHQYRMIGWDSEECTTNYRGVAFLPLNKEGGGEFVVLLNYSRVLLVLRSAEMRWMWLKVVSNASCKDLVTFRGRFYATFLNGDIFVIDPYSLDVTPLMPSQTLNWSNFLVPFGDNELFLVEKLTPAYGLLSFSSSACRVSRLDEEAGEWVEVSDLGDRVLFIGHLGNVCCSVKELPNGCGVRGNSVLFTNEPSSVTFSYKYTEMAEDDLSCWRLSSKDRVMILKRSPVLALWVGC